MIDIDTAIVVVAAGSGTRLGAAEPKAFVSVDDASILRHCLRGVFRAGPAQVIVVAPESHLDEARRAALAEAGGRAELVSVAAGLSRLDPRVETVLVHDAARALTPSDVIDRVADLVRETGHGVLPVLDVVDTIKRTDAGFVTASVDRSMLAAAQTPQGFPRRALLDAYDNATADFTDDTAVVAEAGLPVRRVRGSEDGFKITTPADLDRARDLVRRASRNQPKADDAEGTEMTDDLRGAGRALLPRVGVGTDVHAFGGEGSLWLAGLEWEGEPALSGHSDGDAVAHAIVDAVLNAAGLGDIGTHFGVDRPEFAGAHAGAFLAETARIARSAGWSIGNVSVQMQAQRPRFSHRRAEAEAALSAALGAPVSVSATTTDGLGFTGRAEGVQVFAVAMVVPA
jgi:2-C-methyl-D-erythritol 4-phosphate cytidylyltransferase/2-C-methyl-D-erythritol 2,4-cyclodiphosphate synthase